MNRTDKDYHSKGLPFEKYFARFAELMGLGKDISHNTFDPSKYPFDHELIVDSRIRNNLFELTNPEETTFMNDKIMQNKIDYFHRADPKHLLNWFIVMSFAVISAFIKQLLNNEGITLIVIYRHADNNNRQSFLRHLWHTRLYAVFKRLATPKSPKFYRTIPNQSVTTLTQYPISSSAPPLEQEHYLHQHRDDLSDREILDYLKTPVCPRWITERLKQLEIEG